MVMNEKCGKQYEKVLKNIWIKVSLLARTEKLNKLLYCKLLYCNPKPKFSYQFMSLIFIIASN